jgi:acyl carrier protein
MVDFSSVCADLCAFLRTSLLADGVVFDENTAFTNIHVDSLALVQILLFVERRYGVIIPDTHLVQANLKSVSALSRCVCELIA